MDERLNLLRKTVFYLIAESLLLISVSSITCKNCRAVENPEIKCDPDCTGDICSLWQWEDKAIYQLIQGCITGFDPKTVRMGCRKNSVRATLCLCNNYDSCNDLERADVIALMKLINLPDIQCRNEIEAPYIGDQTSEAVCRSNYCFYTKSSIIGIDGSKQQSVTANCGQLPQFIFDINLYPNWPIPGLFSGGCYSLENDINEVTLGCICNENFCNRDVPFLVTVGNLRCHVSYQITNETNFENGTCYGHFCYIQRDNFPNYGVLYTKGCISVNDTMAEVKLMVGYRNIMGYEQWFCDEDYCNRDIETAEQSIQGKLSAQVSSVTSIRSSFFVSIPLVLYMLFFIKSGYNTAFQKQFF